MIYEKINLGSLLSSLSSQVQLEQHELTQDGQRLKRRTGAVDLPSPMKKRPKISEDHSPLENSELFSSILDNFTNFENSYIHSFLP